MKIGLEYLQSPEKRALDIVGSVLLCPPVLALSGITAAALYKEVGDMRQLFFRQARNGRSGQKILVSKIRTINDKLTHATSEDLTTYGTFDPRAGRIGAFVRQVGIDEAPQIIDVLQGRMSLVGPRPLLDEDKDKYAQADPELFDEWIRIYPEMNPGLCGPSQILRHGRYLYDQEVMRQSMQLDIEYSRSASMSRDIETILTTPRDIVAATQQARAEKIAV